jgi:hypothetical protein
MARVTVLTISGTYDLTSGTLLISLQGEVVVVDSELPGDLPSTSRPPAISIDPPPPSRRNPLLRMSDVFVGCVAPQPGRLERVEPLQLHA